MAAVITTTGGGCFDPTDRPIFFAAGSNLRDDAYPPYILLATNELMTNTTALDYHLDAGRTVLLDSGIFWLTNEHKRAHPGMSMDQALNLPPADIDGFDALWTRYLTLAKRYEDRLWGYIELDQGGAVNKRITRDRLHAEGLNPMPVYHPLNDGWDYFDELAGAYDRMCVGNLVQASRPLRLELLATIWERHRAYPDLWVHGLGLTASELMHDYPLDSCDSSAWVGILRWNHQRTVFADLQMFSAHQLHTRYRLGDQDSYAKAADLTCWAPIEQNLNWRAHYGEAAGLGLVPFPPRGESEAAPCPG